MVFSPTSPLKDPLSPNTKLWRQRRQGAKSQPNVAHPRELKETKRTSVASDRLIPYVLEDWVPRQRPRSMAVESATSPVEWGIGDLCHIFHSKLISLFFC